MITKYRTLKFYGVAFPIEESIFLTAWVDGQLVFKDHVFSQYTFNSGPNTANTAGDLHLLFEREVEFNKMTVDLRLKIEGGVLSFGKVTGNYIISTEDNKGDPKVTYADIAGGREFKSNVRIFDQPIGDYKNNGIWYYHINNSIFDCKISIDPELSSIVPGSRAYNRRLGTPDPFPLKF